VTATFLSLALPFNGICILPVVPGHNRVWSFDILSSGPWL